MEAVGVVAPKTAPDQKEVTPEVRHALINQIWQSLIKQGMDSQDASDAAAVLADRAIDGYTKGGELGGGKFNYDPPTPEEIAKAHAKSASDIKAAGKPKPLPTARKPATNGAQPPGQQGSPGSPPTAPSGGPPVAASYVDRVLRLARPYERLEHGREEMVRGYVGRAAAPPESPLERVRSFAAGERDRVGRHVLPWDEKGGTLHFHDNLGIDRKDMPQITGLDKAGGYHPAAEMMPKLQEELKQYGIPFGKVNVDPAELKPAQSTGDAHAVRVLADSIKSGKSLKPVLISGDNRVLDGHHTWAAGLLARKEGHPMPDGIPAIRIGLSGEDAIRAIRAFQTDQGIQSRGEGEFGRPGLSTPHRMTDPEYQTYATKLDGALQEAVRNGLGTEHTHSPDGGQTWDPDRAKIHDEIVNQLMEKYKDVPAEGKAIIAGGLFGAGKTTTMRKNYPEIQAGHYATISADDIKEELARRGLVPDLPGMPEATAGERTPLVHEESSHISKLLAERLQAQKKNVVWDISMSGLGGTQRRIDNLRAAGYGHVHGMFVHVPVERSIEGAQERHRNGLEDFRAGRNKIGERFVPTDVQRAAQRPGGSLNQEVFEQLKPQFDSWDLFDRSAGGDAKLVGSGGHDGPGGGK